MSYTVHKVGPLGEGNPFTKMFRIRVEKDGEITSALKKSIERRGCVVLKLDRLDDLKNYPEQNIYQATIITKEEKKKKKATGVQCRFEVY